MPAISSSIAKPKKKIGPRDDFPPAIKKLLRDRAGHVCSFPGCDLSTTGPSAENQNSSIANTGQAAHITAAAAGPGARRYDEKLSKEERGSIGNGIWCCATHAALIDRDEVTYSVSMLKHWRKIAELRAQIAQTYGQTEALRIAVSQHGLAPDKVEVEFDGVATSKRIHEIFSLSLIAQWLPEVAWHSVRDFTFEYMHNAFKHGHAKKFEIVFHTGFLSLRHDGGDFPLSALSRQGEFDGGGLFSYNQLRKQMGCPPVELRAPDGMRECQIRLQLTVDVVLNQNPCALDISRAIGYSSPQFLKQESAAFHDELSSRAGCDALFLVAFTATSITHVRDLGPRIKDAIATGKKVIVCFPNTSQAVVTQYKMRFPEIETLDWQETPTSHLNK
ncbi:hypothetical protein [Comamonas sp.]|uniref:hypothetical protein n=1 Tax=Comamonas sp. TaxID=34028 RepID=UPI00258C6223|nr:hypothetical protein [Comamonas sp.]